MPLVGSEQGGDRRLTSWRGIVICLANLVLVISLASRTFDIEIYTHPAVHSQFESAKIQHRDRDASGCVALTVGFFLLWGAAPSTPIEPPEKFYVRIYDQSLYTRPPPLS